jgi:DNA-binding SARP family transcriptional activator/tetratricopeptide (TPR) repeat protein
VGLTADFRLLGRLEVTIGGQPVPILAAKHRVVLAVLLLRANRVVSTDELARRLWGDNPPGNPRGTLQTYVQRLRHTLRHPERVITSPDGYHITVAPDELDLTRFRSLVAAASATEDLTVQAQMLRRALSEWRGQPLADVPSALLQSQDVPQLDEERLHALERCFDVELRTGRHAGLVRELQEITAEHPLRERFSGQLVLALYRCGRQADAFSAYLRLKTALADQLGVDPTEELRALYQAILTNDPSVAAPWPSPGLYSAAGTPVRAWQVPRELPADLGDFVGREQLSEQIGAQLAGGSPLVVMSGPPGTGKTALAVHIAHQLVDQFPHGQLYADMRGYSIKPALSPLQVMSRFLISLGVPAQQVPSDFDELITLYRTLLADRKVLLLLDNAAAPSQVRPLLPSTATCAVLVTSRNELRGLTALQGARPFRLDMLPAGKSLQLLAKIVGLDVIGREPEAAADLAALCGHLPLALRIAAANLAACGEPSMAAFTAELRQGNRLARLAIDGDDEAAVRSAFRLSYAALPPRAAWMFRAVGLIPGADFTVNAVAALTDLPEDEAAQTLDQLVVANLVNRRAGPRYHLHDLVRLFAIEQGHLEDEHVIAEARRRLFLFYLRHVDAAADVLYPVWLRLPRPIAADPVGQVAFADADEAVAWMDRDVLNVIAAIMDAAANGPCQLAWPMAESLRPYLVTRGRYRAEGLAACTQALRAAVKGGNQHAEAAMHNTLGAIYNRHAEYSRAIRHYTGELRAHQATGFVDGQARALITIGNLHQAVGRLEEAAQSVTRGLEMAMQHRSRMLCCLGWLNLSFLEMHRGNLGLAEQAARSALLECDEHGERVTEGECRSIFGEVLLRRGRCGEAVAEFSQSLELYRRSSVSHYEADVLGLLALAYREQGQHDLALRHANQALVIARESGAHDEEADALGTLGSIHRRLGQPEQALAACDQALALSRRIGHVRAEIMALHGLAENSMDCGDLAAATAQAGTALERSMAAGFRTFQGQSQTLLARIALAAGRSETAQEHAGAAVAIHERTGGSLDHARALSVLGQARRVVGDNSMAAAYWRQALGLLPDQAIPDTAELTRLLAAAELEPAEGQSGGPGR